MQQAATVPNHFHRRDRLGAMCLILFAYQCHPEFPLIVAANRDEFYDRPTRATHFWPEHPDLFAGRDLQAGGTWMGITRRGRFAAVTNYREGPPATGYSRSRGELCYRFLASDFSIDDYLLELAAQRSEFAGFNLLVGDFSDLSQPQLGYFSNRLAEPVASLSAGIQGISNGLINCNWPKVTGGCKALAEYLEAEPEQLMSILLDSNTAPRHQLPDTGIEISLEEKLSSRFIAINNYGTRSATVLRLHHSGRVEWLEQTFGSDGTAMARQNHQFELDSTKEALIKSS